MVQPEGGRHPTEPHGDPQRDPFIVYTSESYPEATKFSQDTVSAVEELIPDFEGEIPSNTPTPFSPENFGDIKAREAAMKAGTVNIIRGHADEIRAGERSKYLRDNNINVADYIRQRVFPTGREVYALRFDEFPSKVPDDTNHFNLWIADPNAPQETVVRIVADCLDALGVTPAETVIMEKKRQAYDSTRPRIVGQTADVGLRHMHLYVKKKPFQPTFPI